ncbi:MAG: HPF/RaiA family ribosome-associated protein [Nanoarchaeota archaeon]|nr:HPF/RaiA family ribosome-associated protein [Nanoarchaeota archaeon]
MLIQYVDLQMLNESDVLLLKSLAEMHAQKLERFAPDGTIVVHVKGYSPLGDKVKYSLHVRVPMLQVGAEAVDWDVRKVTHSVFEKLTRALEKKAGKNKAIPPKRR